MRDEGAGISFRGGGLAETIEQHGKVGGNQPLVETERPGGSWPPDRIDLPPIVQNGLCHIAAIAGTDHDLGQMRRMMIEQDRSDAKKQRIVLALEEAVQDLDPKPYLQGKRVSVRVKPGG